MSLGLQEFDESLIRIRAPAGTPIGTGFLIADGVALTCLHVFDRHQEVQIETFDGKTVTAEIAPSDALANVDLALVSCPGIRGRVLPVDVDHDRAEHLYARGFPSGQPGVWGGAMSVEVVVAPGTTAVILNPDQPVVEGVLTLTGGLADPSLSGAPLVDRESGVAIAVVNTRYTKPGSQVGFALPIAVAATRSTRLQDLVERNRAEVPHYGHFLNGRAARAVCTHQRTRAFDSLCKVGKFLPDRYCERPGINAAIDHFLQDGPLILPMIGPSGVGKTSALACLAQTAGETPMVLLTADTIDAARPSLRSAVERELRAAAVKELPSDRSLEAVISALHREGDSLIVLLDGLDELRQRLRPSLGPWIKRMLSWLESAQVRLILTCRPEYWDLVSDQIPDDLLFGAPARADRKADRAPGLSINNFSESEASEALHRYGLAGSGLSAGEVRHPFLARVYWETFRPGGGEIAPLSHYDAAKHLIDFKCHKVAWTLNGAVSTKVILYLLTRAATATLQRGDVVLDEGTYWTIFATETEKRVGRELIREHLLRETRAGYQFVFEQVLEFLQARALPLDASAREALLQDRDGVSMPVRDGTAVLWFTRLEREHDLQAVQKGLDDLIELYAKRQDVLIRWLLASLFLGLGRTSQFLTSLQRFVEVISQNETEADPFVLDMIRGVDLSLAERLALIRLLIKVENSYDWEPQHWARLDDRVFAPGLDSYARLVGELIEHSPVASFRELCSWLEDRTPLGGGTGSVTVTQLAQGLLARFSPLAFEELCDLLRANGSLDAAWLVGHLSKAYPARMARVCQRWSRSDLGGQELAAMYGHRMLANELDPTVEHDVLVMLERLAHTSSSPIAATTARMGLNKREATREQVLDDLIDAFRRDDPLVPPVEFAFSMPTHFQRVFEAFVAYLQDGADADRKRGILRMLVGRPGDAMQQVVALLHRVMTDDPSLHDELSLTVERMLYRVDAFPEVSMDLLALAERIIRQPSADVRRPIIHFAAGPTTSQEGERLRARLLKILIESETDAANRSLILKSLAKYSRQLPGARDAIFALGARMEPELFERKLVTNALLDRDFAQLLAEWLADGAGFQPRHKAREFLDAVQGGIDPKKSARQVLLGGSG